MLYFIYDITDIIFKILIEYCKILIQHVLMFVLFSSTEPVMSICCVYYNNILCCHEIRDEKQNELEPHYYGISNFIVDVDLFGVKIL